MCCVKPIDVKSAQVSDDIFLWGYMTPKQNRLFSYRNNTPAQGHIRIFQNLFINIIGQFIQLTQYGFQMFKQS